MISPLILYHAVPGEDDITRVVLDNGITVLTRRNEHAHSVYMTGSIEAGSLIEPKRGLANFMSGMLLRGTESRDFSAIHETLEDAGANLHINGTRHTINFGGKCLDEDLPMLMDLLADALRRPAFPENQFERLRGEMLTYLNLRQQNTRYRAGRRLVELVFPPEHPYHHSQTGDAEDIQALSIEDMKDFHHAQFGPSGMIVVVAGNITADHAVNLVQQAFGDWQNPRQQPMPDVPDVAPLPSIQADKVVVAGKSQVDIALGVPGPSRFADDFQAARLANHILGVFGMYGRLGKNIREAKGLAYYCHSQVPAGLGPSIWRASAGVDPANVRQAIDSIRFEIERMIETPVDAEDLADSKANMIGSLPLQLESNEGVAGSIYNMERYQLGLDYLHRYADIINSITADDLQAAMQHYWQTSAPAVAVAGPAIDEVLT